MPLIRLSDKVILFIHIPKTGGSTISDYFQQVGSVSLKYRGRWGPCAPQHIHAEVIKRLVPDAFYDYSFAIVRNPYGRLLSEYKARRGGRQSSGRTVSFSRWAMELSDKYAADPYVDDNHLRPQHEFLLDGTEVFRFEDGVAKVVKSVMDRMGLTPAMPVPHSNPSAEIKVRVTLEAMARVKSFYAADFEKLGYDADIDAFLGQNIGMIDVIANDDPPTVKERIKQISRLKPALRAIRKARKFVRAAARP